MGTRGRAALRGRPSRAGGAQALGSGARRQGVGGGRNIFLVPKFVFWLYILLIKVIWCSHGPSRNGTRR
jgi:hypothetical protein